MGHPAPLFHLADRLPSLLYLLSLLFLTLYAYRHIWLDPAALGDDPADYPEWDYLWDDSKNYYDNPRVQTLTWDNVRWAFREGGVVHGVYEPVALMIKQALHACIEFDARTYRVVNLAWHCANVVLVFSVGRMFLGSANEYGSRERRLREEMLGEGGRSAESKEEEEEGEVAGGENGAAPTSAGADGGANGPSAWRRWRGRG